MVVTYIEKPRARATVSQRLCKLGGFVFFSLMLMWFTATPALAAHDTIYVDKSSFNELLSYDSAATTSCLHNKISIKPTIKVVFKKDKGKVVYWSPSTPNIYYANLGWSNCKGYRRKG